ncbi:DNA adenine methylase [Sphingobacterium hotanense]|uniref:DNA adenine methylase n=1 Tax=Sphingobacterium hotanense TaxID=649196 RepID=UPI0021A5FF2E|nr:Dam family site-specific DNA-(adenine-N6)-methyltransferase [Sphingobacterium hotanense]MCT1524149.1 Dam family site-specific DNA-(adenine-N6)-methyltransferase [Sphingobacterium hotanense]
MKDILAKPFLRWAGGKNWLVKQLCNYLPTSGFNDYHEPFIGGASVFFSLKPKKAYLSDLNGELIETYQQIRDNVENVIEVLRAFENTEEYYYKIRETTFTEAESRAARFIYLNQTSFNGIYRVNLKGVYNVPYGYRSKDFCDKKLLRQASEVLKHSTLFNGDFYETIKNVKPNDLVFLDPPYTVTHNNNGFIKYNKNLFDLDSQLRLSKYLDEINSIGASYILTNAAHQDIIAIFQKDNNTIKTVDRVSLVGGKNAQRGRYAELIITNIPSIGQLN